MSRTVVGWIMARFPVKHAWALAVCLAAVATLHADSSPEPKDCTHIDVAKLGIKPVAPHKDPRTGFVVGGKNPTALIGKLTEIAGRSIADLEEDMRPGALSTAGFLGKDESLLAVLAADNRMVVDQLHLTHQELALHLQVLGAIALEEGRGEPKEVLYHGRRYRLQARVFQRQVGSPFLDRTRTNSEVTIENRSNGRKVSYSLLVPHMVERYGFYEGKGTRYRVEPEKVVEVLDFLRRNERR